MTASALDLKAMSIGVAIGFTASAAAVAAYSWFKSSSAAGTGAKQGVAAAAAGPVSAKANKTHWAKREARADFKLNAVTADEWVTARKALMNRERELMRQIDAVAAARKQLPFTEVQDYALVNSTGAAVRLSELFESGKNELVIWHMMYAADWKNACSSCSFWLDGFNGSYRHISQRASFAAVGKASPQQLAQLKAQKGWAFPVVSSAQSTFNSDFKVEDKATYNFGHGAAEDHPPVSQYPGVSVFYRDDKTGKLYRTYSAYARGFELTNGVWALFDMLPFGRESFWPKHDYTAAAAK